MDLIKFWLNPAQISILKNAISAAGDAALAPTAEPVRYAPPAVNDSLDALLKHARRVNFKRAALTN